MRESFRVAHIGGVTLNKRSFDEGTSEEMVQSEGVDDEN